MTQSSPIKPLAKHLYEVWESMVREKTPSIEPIHFVLLPATIQEAWERVARECIMEAEALTRLKKLL
jgi:hypothetical protein